MASDIHAIDTAGAWQQEAMFEQVFRQHYKALHGYACSLLREAAIAEGVVQQVFLELWEKRDSLPLQDGIRPYLFRSVHNRSLNHLKRQKLQLAYVAHATSVPPPSDTRSDSALQLKELEQRIQKALEALPAQCRNIFEMSRFGEMKYQEIAEALDISVKTVEAQMSKALKRLRASLADYLPALWLCWLLTNPFV